jgi:hypothetical protein
MTSKLALALLASLLVPAAGCGSETANPISTGGSSASSGTGTTSSSHGATGSGGSGGSAPATACEPACGSGEVCVESACHALTQLASPGGSPCTMLLDAANVYIATTQVQTVSRTGGTITAPGLWIGQPALAADDTYLYFNAGNGGIDRAPKTGGFGQPFAGETVLGPATHMVSDGSTLYFLEGATDMAPPSVYEAPTTGTPVDPTMVPAIFASDGYGLGTVAVDASSVYFCGGSGGLVKEDKTTQDVTVLDASLCPDYIVPDGASVYYSTVPAAGAAGVVARVSGAGGAPTVLTDATLGVNGVFAVDADSIYFMTFSAVMKVSKGGGSPVMVSALSLTTPFATCMAADDTNVYWIDDGNLMQYTK